MSGRGIEKDPKGRRWSGRGRGSSPLVRGGQKTEAKFKGANPDLPCLNYGASPKENKPIEILLLFGEYCAIKLKPSIAQAFWTSPPEYGEVTPEPVMPDPIPNTNAGKAQLAEYKNDRKEWKIETKKIDEDIKSAFAMQDHEDWVDNFNRRDLLYLIGRIRSTHIARQSGNPVEDMERVRMAWANMRMYPNEISFAFRKRVEEYQLERTTVGLEKIPADELIISILNRLDMSRYHSLVKDYLDNKRCGIADLPELPSIQWKVWHCPALQTHPCLCSLDLYKSIRRCKAHLIGVILLYRSSEHRRGCVCKDYTTKAAVEAADVEVVVAVAGDTVHFSDTT
jgi:hypothetical protein